MTTFNTELGRFYYTVMPFGATVVGDVFQHKLDECFGKIEQVIIIAGDIMIVRCQNGSHNFCFSLFYLIYTVFINYTHIIHWFVLNIYWNI